MKFCVTFDVFETIHSVDDVRRARESAGKHIQKLQSSGKMSDGGIFGDRRGGFFLLDLDSPTELYDLIGDLYDICRINVHPVLTFEELGEFFKKETEAE